MNELCIWGTSICVVINIWGYILVQTIKLLIKTIKNNIE